MCSYCYVCSFLGILFYSVVLCIVCVYMCTVLLPPGGYPIAVKNYIISLNELLNESNFHVTVC
jgi:hypothetical protein